MSLAPYFTKEFWQGKYPQWQDYDALKSLGLPEIKTQKAAAFKPAPQAPKATPGATPATAANQESPWLMQLIYGLVLGIGAYALIMNRQKILKLFKK